MQSVFGLTADAADQRGFSSLLKLCLRELRDLPGAIAREYRRDRILSFGLYGGTLFALFITLDDYAGEEIYRLTSVLLLTGGGWGYLRARRYWQRALILFAAFTLAMAVAAGGKAILYWTLAKTET